MANHKSSNSLRKYRGHSKRISRSKWAKQRINRGFADCDVWNMSDFLVELIPDMLQHLAENSMGYPYKYTPESWTEELQSLEKKFRKISEIQEDMEDQFVKLPSSEWGSLNEKLQEAIDDAFASLAKDFSLLCD